MPKMEETILRKDKKKRELEKVSIPAAIPQHRGSAAEIKKIKKPIVKEI